MAAVDARHETRSMLDGIDRWENEGGRYASQTPTAAAPLAVPVSGAERMRAAASRVEEGQLLTRRRDHVGWDAATPTLGPAERPDARRQR
jgi:hypothetical protein